MLLLCIVKGKRNFSSQAVCYIENIIPAMSTFYFKQEPYCLGRARWIIPWLYLMQPQIYKKMIAVLWFNLLFHPAWSWIWSWKPFWLFNISYFHKILFFILASNKMNESTLLHSLGLKNENFQNPRNKQGHYRILPKN